MLLMLAHPVEEPRIRLILNADLYINEQSLPEQTSSTSQSSLPKCCNSSKTCKAEASREERIACELREDAAVTRAGAGNSR